MFLKEFRIQSIKCFEDLTLKFKRPDDEERKGGWYVLLGENGTGKSTLLKAIALTLIGPARANHFWRDLDAGGWPRRGRQMSDGRDAGMAAKIAPDEGDGDGKGPRCITAGLALGEQEFAPRGPKSAPVSQSLWSRASEKRGWFFAAYGPYRRVSGTPVRQRKSDPIEARVDSLFVEDLDFLDALSWLDVVPPPQDAGAPKPLVDVRAREALSELLNDSDTALLPPGHEVVMYSQLAPYRPGPACRTPDGTDVPLWELGDGFRSATALIFDLLRHLFPRSRGDAPPDGGSRAASASTGVVLIDEPDAHLHPRWQRSVGLALKEAFPNIQFIVATHSPFVCQAGEPGALYVLQRQDGGAVTATTDIESVRGWQANQILTELQGLSTTRDPETEEKLEEYEALFARSHGEKLTEKERKRLAELEQELRQRLDAPGDTLEEREMYREMRRYVERHREEQGVGRPDGAAETPAT